MKIEIVVSPQGQISVNYPDNVPPPVLIGIIEMAKSVLISNMSKPASPIVAASATDILR